MPHAHNITSKVALMQCSFTPGQRFKWALKSKLKNWLDNGLIDIVQSAKYGLCRLCWLVLKQGTTKSICFVIIFPGKNGWPAWTSAFATAQPFCFQREAVVSLPVPILTSLPLRSPGRPQGKLHDPRWDILQPPWQSQYVSMVYYHIIYIYMCIYIYSYIYNIYILKKY
jgi:hypothetical protein